jgi:hypothetical protein
MCGRSDPLSRRAPLEDNQTEEFREEYRQAIGLFSKAQKLGPGDLGVAAAIGGAYAVFADRLSLEYRAAAWSQAYDSYQALWKRPAPVAEKPTGRCEYSHSTG